MFGWVQDFLQGFFDFIALIWYIITHPFEFLSFLVCSAVGSIFHVLPSTPDNLKIANLISQLGSTFPLIGSGVIHELFTTVASIVGILVLIKVYKLLPFKMS
jgi:hypothetical protein